MSESKSMLGVHVTLYTGAKSEAVNGDCMRIQVGDNSYTRVAAIEQIEAVLKWLKSVDENSPVVGKEMQKCVECYKKIVHPDRKFKVCLDCFIEKWLECVSDDTPARLIVSGWRK